MKWLKLFGMVTILSGFGKLLGFFREALIASLFGASQTADIFFVAFLIPTILFTALGTGIQAGIIPLYIEEKQKSAHEAAQLMRRLGTFFIALSLVITIIAMLLAKPLVYLFAPGFETTQLSLATMLTLIMMPSLIFMTAQSLAQGLLHANDTFGPPAWAPIVNNLGIIISMYIFYNWLGIYGLAVGVLIGSILQIIIQWPWIHTSHWSSEKLMIWKEWPAIKKVLRPFWPIILASIVVQLNGVVDRVVSSFLVDGSVSALNYGNRLLWLPLSIMLMPISVIMYPQLAKEAGKGIQSFLHLVHRGMNIIIVTALPLTIVMILEAKLLVSLAFERGAFDNQAVNLTAMAFLFFAIALPFFALRDYLMNSVYAYKANKVALRSCVYGVGLNIILSASLAPFIGIGGVALGTSASMLVQSIYLYHCLKQIEKVKDTQFFVKDWLKLLVVFIIVLISTWFLTEWIALDQQWIRLISTTLITFILFIALVWLGKLTILKQELNRLLRKDASS
ncbi:murein biosynthesis integral membrane protein MurJ [Halobacillus amylolyticus]|uniref:Probable lipid II flippase MurJ n=1 Tax=Halobacillus amylolyticus TaxID=2932259 RepID=A0ABY4H9W0_9BACI|nr:murein biosynthesis integral membrane protein MurJ [Halobacillus amylolyticus]UOR11650.1 murein biosynthesis integral membrane protein MurJ [Halobacillus amylolyticus]